MKALSGLALVLLIMFASVANAVDCSLGCSGKQVPVCGSDGRIYQNECLALCQGVSVAEDTTCDATTGPALTSRSTPLTLEEIKRFSDEGFSLVGQGIAKPFDPATKSAQIAADVKKAGAHAFRATGPNELRAVRYSSDGLVYIGTLSEAHFAKMVGSTPDTMAKGYVPPGMPVDADPVKSSDNKTRQLLGIFGNDDRKQITFKGYPFSAIGQLTLSHINGDRYLCSGSMISARSVLTAGHCVYDRDSQSWQEDFTFSANRLSTYNNPFGVAMFWSYVTTFNGYVSSNSYWLYDFAVVQFRDNNFNYGGATGWLGIENVYSSSNWLTTAGYPGDKASGTYWYTKCFVTDSNGNDGTITHYCDTKGGQSGSPMFAVKNGSPYIRGVVTYEFTSGGTPTKNVATEVTSLLFKSIVSWK